MAVEHRRGTPPPPSFARVRDTFWWRHPRLVQVLGLAALLLGAVYLTWRIGWSGNGAPLPLYLTLLAAELFGYLSLALYVFLGWRVPHEVVRPALPEILPSIDVYVCTYDENDAILEATLAGCRAMAVPHTTYLLDDGRRDHLRALADRFGARYLTRPDNSHAKAGNINHALTRTSGELILFLDADHVPMPAMLEATVGFFTDPGIALVQTPHDFSNRDSVQHSRVERHEQSLFYEVIAPGKDRHDAMFWCGSATLVRRTALDDVGGVQTATVAEDFHTTIAMHARGWHTRYHDESLVQGLAPHDLAGFLLQRARWARGNLAVFRTPQNPVVGRGLRPVQRVSYTASLLNYFSGLQRFTLLVVLVLTLATGRLPMHASLATLLAVWLPWSIVAFVATAALGRGSLGFFDATRYGILTIGIYLRGIAALAVPRTGRFKVTPKEGVDTGGLVVLRMLGLVTVTAAALQVIWVLRALDLVGVAVLPSMPELASVITLGLGVWELGCIVVVVVPLVRRHQVRSRYRVPVTLQARIDRTTTIVPVHDLTPDGCGFDANVALTAGTTITLLTRIGDTVGELHDVRLPAVVRSCATIDDGSHPYRIGAQFAPLDARTHEALVEYCFVVNPELRLRPRDVEDASGRTRAARHEPAAATRAS